MIEDHLIAGGAGHGRLRSSANLTALPAVIRLSAAVATFPALNTRRI
jgi:hypothetical protein